MVFAQAMPDLCRQRVVIEGTCDTPISDTCKLFDVEQAVDYTQRFFSAPRIVAKAF